jgi:hypothetical protein
MIGGFRRHRGEPRRAHLLPGPQLQGLPRHGIPGGHEKGSKDRYYQTEQAEATTNWSPKGSSAGYPTAASYRPTIHQLIGGLKAGHGLCAAAAPIEELRDQGPLHQDQLPPGCAGATCTTSSSPRKPRTTGLNEPVRWANSPARMVDRPAAPAPLYGSRADRLLSQRRDRYIDRPASCLNRKPLLPLFTPDLRQDRMPSKFVHLHVHTQYSLLDGAIRIDRCSSARPNSACRRWPSPITAPCSGLWSFTTRPQGRHQADDRLRMLRGAAQPADKTPQDSKGVDPPDPAGGKPGGLPQSVPAGHRWPSWRGFTTNRASTRSSCEGPQQGPDRPSACLQGEIPRRIRENRLDLADAAARSYLEIFGEGTFFWSPEQRHRTPGAVNQALREMSRAPPSRWWPATTATIWTRRTCAPTMCCCASRPAKPSTIPSASNSAPTSFISNPRRRWPPISGITPDAIENSVAIAERCQIEFDLKHLPFSPVRQRNRHAAGGALRAAGARGLRAGHAGSAS